MPPAITRARWGECSAARCRSDEDAFWLITATAAQAYDGDWLRDHLSPGLTLVEETEAWSCQIVTGPAARSVLAGVTSADLALPRLSWQAAQPGGGRGDPDARLLRQRAGVGGACPASRHARGVRGADEGGAPAGAAALRHVRAGRPAAKGYRTWKGDLSTDYTALQAGLGRVIDFGKGAFRERDALLAERAAGPVKRFAILRVAAGEEDAPYMSRLWRGDRVVGETTSGGWGHRVGAPLALGMVRADLVEPGTALEVEIFGRRYPAEVLESPAWDPLNARLRG
ncbi:glycine cleavage T C-terminal barrel domain-containing protein [Acidimangrovimonas sediminis]|uniref:glycine cleavage T C-terminal barrel domain-containing protein n=1 Tax=Acidimangrovimonas sediminis TaxID=2056283 RepID=UPI000C809AA2|nr:glycine cleavage T C-terminal barrel domain-containing protein [Acidimangrovimonas sediminis]